MLETINRDILIIFPKQPLMDWINYIFPEEKHECPKVMENDQGNIYLIPEFFNPDEAIIYIKKNFKEYFENELFEWCTDENEWPKPLTWKLFNEWFYYSYQSVAIDTINERIEKDEY